MIQGRGYWIRRQGTTFLGWFPCVTLGHSGSALSDTQHFFWSEGLDKGPSSTGTLKIRADLWRLPLPPALKMPPSPVITLGSPWESLGPIDFTWLPSRSWDNNLFIFSSASCLEILEVYKRFKVITEVTIQTIQHVWRKVNFYFPLMHFQSTPPLSHLPLPNFRGQVSDPFTSFLCSNIDILYTV